MEATTLILDAVQQTADGEVKPVAATLHFTPDGMANLIEITELRPLAPRPEVPQNPVLDAAEPTADAIAEPFAADAEAAQPE